jgi:hypothetical protein
MKYFTLLALFIIGCGFHGRGKLMEDIIEDAHIEGEDNSVYLNFLEDGVWELTLSSFVEFRTDTDRKEGAVLSQYRKELKRRFPIEYRKGVRKIFKNQEWCVKTKHSDSLFVPTLKESLDTDDIFEIYIQIRSKYPNCLQRGIKKLVGGSPKVEKDSNGITRFYWKNPPISKTHKIVMNAGEFISSNASFMKLGRAHWENNPPTIKAVVKEGDNNQTRNVAIASSVATIGIVALAFVIGIKALVVLPIIALGALIYTLGSEPNRDVDMTSVLDNPREQILDCLAPLSAFERTQKKSLKKDLELTSVSEDELNQLNNSICEYKSIQGQLSVSLKENIGTCKAETNWKIYFNKKNHPRWESTESRACRRVYR